MNINEYFRPESIDEAYEILQTHNAAVIGGGAFLNLSEKNIESAVDLSKLGLDYVVEKDGQIEIGAMATLRSIETSSVIKQNFSGVLAKAASSIMGVQLRNTATIGGAVYGRYGFSDILTPLLAIDASIELYKGGKMSLEEFMEAKVSKDILLKVTIKQEEVKASYLSVRNTSTDFPVLNAAATFNSGKFRICVGARPLKAKTASETMMFINNVEANEENAALAGEVAAMELQFGSDIRASAEYRKELCKVLVKRCILEVV